MKLGDIARVQGGYAFKSSEFQETGTPIIRIGNLDGDFVNIDNKICYPDDFSIKHPEFLIDKGDVLVAMSGATVGKIGVFIDDTKALLNQRVGKIIPLGDIDKRVLYYYCKSPSFMNLIQKEAFGCAQPNISSKSLEGFEINMPTTDQHNEMINVLDRVSKIIENKKQQLSEYDYLLKSRFVEMFGDPKINNKRFPLVKPEEICESISAGGDRPNEVSSIRTEEFLYPIFSNGEKDDGLYGWSKGYRIEKPAVTISGRGTIGYTSFRKDGKFTPIVRLIVMIPNEKVNPIYLTYYMNLEREIGSGSGVQQLTVPMIKEKSIILPDIVDQNYFAQLVEQIDKLKFNVQRSLDETQKLFDSLMQEYFG